MSRGNVAPEEKVLMVKIGIVSALKVLQARLGETHEGMARRLGCTFSAYSKWLYGVNIPSGDWMLRILAVCPDEETQRNFLDIGKIGDKLPSISRRRAPTIINPDEARPARTRADQRMIRAPNIPKKNK